MHRFLISGGQLGNRCRVLPVYALLRASILDFKPRLANRCRVFPVYTLFRASILDFRLRLANRCKVFPVLALFRASILDFRPRLGNRCSVIAAAVRNGPPATAVVAAIFRVRFYSSLPQSRMVSPAAAVAATSSASYSNLRCLEGDQKLNARPTPLLVAPSDRLGVLPFLSGFTYVLL